MTAEPSAVNPSSTSAAGPTEFTLRGSAKVAGGLFLTAAVVFGSFFVYSAVTEGPLVMLVFFAFWWAVVLGQIRWFVFVLPWTIRLEQDEVVFLDRRGRRRAIAYSALQAVEPLPFDFQRQSARWVSTGCTVWTVTYYRNWQRLLLAVAERAPHASVD